jgi:hypothetical protein
MDDPICLIKELESEHHTPDSILLCADVANLHPSIDIEDGLQCFAVFIDEIEIKESLPAGVNKNLILDLLHFVLTHNYFTFSNLNYLQIKGTAMGTSCAPTYAIAVMHVKEQQTLLFLQSNAEFTPFPIFKRYIDDYFIKACNRRSAELFIDTFNKQHPTIQLPTSSLQFGDRVTAVNHLDVSYIISTDGSIRIEPYIKPMNTFQYLHAKSSHNKSTFTAFIISELNRFMIRSSDFYIFAYYRDQFRKHLLNRGYEFQYIENLFDDHFGAVPDIADTFLDFRTKLIEKRIEKKYQTLQNKRLPMIFSTTVRLERIDMKRLLQTSDTCIACSPEFMTTFANANPIISKSGYNYISNYIASTKYTNFIDPFRVAL